MTAKQRIPQLVDSYSQTAAVRVGQVLNQLNHNKASSAGSFLSLFTFILTCLSYTVDLTQMQLKEAVIHYKQHLYQCLFTVSAPWLLL